MALIGGGMMGFCVPLTAKVIQRQDQPERLEKMGTEFMTTGLRGFKLHYKGFYGFKRRAS